MRIINIKYGLEEPLKDNQYVLEENQEYLVELDDGNFIKEDFKSIGTYISPKLGILSSTNKIGLVTLKNTLIRIRSKLGDDFFNNLKKEIAEIEKFLLLSSNGLEDRFGLSYGTFLDEVALSVFMNEWEKGKTAQILRIIFENPSEGLRNKVINKNLIHGDVLEEIDFQFLNCDLNQLVLNNNRVLPTFFRSVIREKTNDVIEMRFVKFFLFFSVNLLERNISIQSKTINALQKNFQNLETGDSEKTLKIEEVSQTIEKVKEKQKKLHDIKVILNRYLKSNILKEVIFAGNLDFTSLKLHNNFHFKFLLELFLKMRRTFDVLTNRNLVHLDINSVENLYEFYCYIKIIKSFEISQEEVKKVIRKTNSGWLIDKSKSIYLGVYNDFKLLLFFKKNYSAGIDTYSQDYEPDFSIVVEDDSGKSKYLHLDAKYKHNNQIVKKEDIDKMHTYSHAIKSTVASIVLFPGKYELLYECNNSVVGALPCNTTDYLDMKTRVLELLKLK